MTTIGESDALDDSVVVIGDVPKPRYHGNDHEDEDLGSTSISNSYCGEYQRLFQRPDYMARLRRSGVKGQLRSSRFRSVCWKLYLEVLSQDQTRWLSQTRVWRDKYEQLKNKLIVNPRASMEGSNVSLNNPLSQEVESPWNQFFQDNELRVTIKQDVIRTFPEILFFQDGSLQETMTDILFCYSKDHSSLSYKQGMHELLAPLIFILHCDHQAFLHACEIETVGEVIKEILDPSFVEHDAYAMFYQIMETVEPWYVSKEISPTIKMKSVVHAQPFARHQDLHPSNVIVTKLTRIQDYLLRKYDAELHQHLERMDIAPQIYGIRWVRLLFGREFPMQDLLMLWDAIFAEGISFDLVDYVFVAMLLYIRDAMLTSDYPSCLHLLMKFPPVGDVHYFVDKALHLREPNDYPAPRPYTYQKPANFGHEWETRGTRRATNRARGNHRGAQMNTVAEKAASVVTSGLSTFTRRMSKNRRPRNLHVTNGNQMSKSTSEPMNLLTDQSPEDSQRFLPHHPHQYPGRKGSTASLSQLETTNSTEMMVPLRPACSTQSLAGVSGVEPRGCVHTPDLTGGHSTGHARSNSMTSSMIRSLGRDPAMWSSMDSASSRYSSRPGSGGGAWRPDQSGPSLADQSGPSLAMTLGRLHDLETLCGRCADKMGGHIDKLQKELLSQNVNNEDELLLALAGLKQVRDVLKGTLKPSSVFDAEEISIHDNHYQDDLIPGAARQDSSVSSGLTTPRSYSPPIDGPRGVLSDLNHTDTSPALPAGVSTYSDSSSALSTGTADSSPYSTDNMTASNGQQNTTSTENQTHSTGRLNPFNKLTDSISPQDSYSTPLIPDNFDLPDPSCITPNRAGSDHQAPGRDSQAPGSDRCPPGDHPAPPLLVTLRAAPTSQPREFELTAVSNGDDHSVLGGRYDGRPVELSRPPAVQTVDKSATLKPSKLPNYDDKPAAAQWVHYDDGGDKSPFAVIEAPNPSGYRAESDKQPSGYRSQLDEEWFGRYSQPSSAPPTPYETRRTKPLSRKHSSGALHDNNQNSPSGGGFPGGGFSKGVTPVSSSASRANSARDNPGAMNKITDLFKGAFKF